MTTEREFQSAVIELAQLMGWRVAHFRTSMNKRGNYQTAVAADGKGFPDLVMVHPRRKALSFVELKSDTGRLTSEQKEWLADLHAAGVDAHVWRPRDWPEIEAALTGKGGDHG